MKNLLIILILTAFVLQGYAQPADEIKFTTKPKNLGKNINSVFKDAEPKISPDGKTLYFCRRADSRNIEGSGVGADIWFSELTNNVWGPAKNLGRPVNDEAFNQMIGIRSDGNAIIVKGKWDEAAFTELYLHNKTPQGWGKAEPIKFDDVNWNYAESGASYCVSVDFKTMIISFVDNGKSESNLYVSFYLEKNIWSKPTYMGDVVNTEYGNEIYPTLGNDGTTLYYSSDGFGGYGKQDIYITRRLDNTWANWEKPRNLGNVVNGPGFDSDFTLDAEAKFGYISSDVDTTVDFDIYSIELPEEARPNPVVMVTGKVLNSKTKLPIETDVVFYTLKEGTVLGRGRSNPVTGAYNLVLPYGQKYALSAIAPNYFPISDFLDLTNVDKFRKVEKILEIAPIENGSTVRLNNLFFEYGSANLNDESYAEIEKVIDLLKQFPAMSIEIQGHTDNIGQDASTMKLSTDRAKTVADYIVSKGIGINRVAFKGFGKTKPKYPNNSEENRKKNRRVEFQIIKVQ